MFEILSKLLPLDRIFFFFFSFSPSSPASYRRPLRLHFRVDRVAVQVGYEASSSSVCLVNFRSINLGTCLYSTATFFELGDFFAVIATRVVDVFDNVIDLFNEPVVKVGSLQINFILRSSLHGATSNFLNSDFIARSARDSFADTTQSRCPVFTRQQAAAGPSAGRPWALLKLLHRSTSASGRCVWLHISQRCSSQLVEW